MKLLWEILRASGGSGGRGGRGYGVFLGHRRIVATEGSLRARARDLGPSLHTAVSGSEAAARRSA